VAEENNNDLTSDFVSVLAGGQGANRFYDNIEDMIGFRPWPLIKLSLDGVHPGSVLGKCNYDQHGILCWVPALLICLQGAAVIFSNCCEEAEACP